MSVSWLKGNISRYGIILPKFFYFISVLTLLNYLWILAELNWEGSIKRLTYDICHLLVGRGIMLEQYICHALPKWKHLTEWFDKSQDAEGLYLINFMRLLLLALLCYALIYCAWMSYELFWTWKFLCYVLNNSSYYCSSPILF